MKRWFTEAGVLAMLFVGAMALSVIGLVVATDTATPAAKPAPAWCDYPDDDGAAALEQATQASVANIAKYSPGQPVDAFTLQLGLMSECAR